MDESTEVATDVLKSQTMSAVNFDAMPTSSTTDNIVSTVPSQFIVIQRQQMTSAGNC